jgi:hypothetical protein
MQTHGSALDGSFQPEELLTGGGRVAALESPEGNKRSNTSAPLEKHLKVAVKATEALEAAHGMER